MQNSPVLHIFVDDRQLATLPIALIAERLDVAMSTYDEVIAGVKLFVEDLINVAVQHFVPADEQKLLESFADTYYPDVPDSLNDSYMVSSNHNETEFTLIIPGDSVHRPIPVC